MNETATATPADPFIEQAEYLESEEFRAWTEEHPRERLILQKLCRGGAKLITGPRGCGKTTLLLKAYRQLLPPNSRGLPVYVNFKSSLRLEPLYKNQANASYWFNQWMLYKCYSSLMTTIEDLQLSTGITLRLSKEEAQRSAENLEMGADESIIRSQPELSVSHLIDDIERLLDATGRTRCLLFLDDAAHAFSPDQQRDFFDFFRRVKNVRIAPKAAIYPGVTIISPSFHIGHDAEEIDVWLDPYSSEYLPFMRGLLKRRLSSDDFKRLAESPDFLDLLCFAAFGVPRALLNMVRTFCTDEDSGKAIDRRVNASAVLRSIREAYERTRGVYDSLRHKLPIYENFINAGDSLLDRMMAAIKKYNRDKPEGRQSVSIAIQTPLEPELERVFGFLQYAGLVMFDRKVSRGVKGRFEVYSLHAGGLIDRNALLGRRSVQAKLFSRALKLRNAHEFTRVTPSRLLQVEDLKKLLTLALPPCPSCGTARASESAKFCLQCGSPLTALSTFRQLVARDIDELPISDRRAKRIKEHSSIRTIGDILMDHEHRKLRGVPWIGPYWAQRIYSYAEEYIA